MRAAVVGVLVGCTGTGVPAADGGATMPVAQVAVGDLHSCAIDATATLWCWGGNRSGQLGVGDLAPRLTRTQVGAAGDWISIDAAFEWTCGVHRDHTVDCWGLNAGGALGLGDDTTRTSPAHVAVPDPALAVSVGIYGGKAGLTTGGTRWSWGGNRNGELGDGATDLSAVQPTRGLLDGWTSVAMGGLHGCGIRTDRSLWCWGTGGGLGLGTAGVQPVPQHVAPGTTWLTVSAGYDHTCGIQTDHSLWCWGDNGDGELGDGTSQGVYVPERIAGGFGDGDGEFVDVAAGNYRTCAIRSNATLACWGNNKAGQLGVGDTGVYWTPTAVAGTGWRQVDSSGADHTCAVNAADEIYCWGGGHDGELGTGDTSDSLVPVRVM